MTSIVARAKFWNLPLFANRNNISYISPIQYYVILNNSQFMDYLIYVSIVYIRHVSTTM